MKTAVEIPLLCESSAAHAPTAAPEFERDHPSREFPLSSFDPLSGRSLPAVAGSPQSAIGPQDYDALIAELNRLEEKCQAIKMRLAILDFAEPVGTAAAFCQSKIENRNSKIPQ